MPRKKTKGESTVTRKRGGRNDREGTGDDTDESPKRLRKSPGEFISPSDNGAEAEDGVSSLQEGSSVQRNAMEEKCGGDWRRDCRARRKEKPETKERARQAR